MKFDWQKFYNGLQIVAGTAAAACSAVAIKVNPQMPLTQKLFTGFGVYSGIRTMQSGISGFSAPTATSETVAEVPAIAEVAK